MGSFNASVNIFSMLRIIATLCVDDKGNVILSSEAVLALNQKVILVVREDSIDSI